MSDLQLALIALGVAIIVAVVLFNIWQERRLRRESAKRFEAPENDALLNDFHMDPQTLAIENEQVLAVEHEPETSHQPLVELGSANDAEQEPLALPSLTVDEAPAQEPDANKAPADAAAGVPPLIAADPTLVEAEMPVPAAGPVEAPLPGAFDARLDLVALVYFAAPVSAADLRRELRLLPQIERHNQWLGLDANDAWIIINEALDAALFNGLACALQLVDRSGAVSGDVLRDFQIKIEYLASNLEARVEWLGAADPQQQAVMLDQFCLEVDVAVGLHVIQSGNGPFAGTKLRGLAEAGGMKLGENGKFHFVSEGGELLFELSDQDRRPFSSESLRSAFVRGISLRLDVPRVSQGAEAFQQMASLARKMESALRGVLVDDHQRALNDTDLEKIRQQLKGLCARMTERGIKPGSPTALRLFS